MDITNLRHVKFWACGVGFWGTTLVESFSLGRGSTLAFKGGAICYSLLIPIALAILENNQSKEKNSNKIIGGVLAFFFAQSCILGQCFYFSHSWQPCFGDWWHFSAWLIQSFCLTIIYYKLLLSILSRIEHFYSQQPNYRLNLNHWFWIIFGIRVLFFIAFYPCVFDYDGVVGLRTLLSPEYIACNHHPFFVQLLHGGAYLLGEKIGHLSLGFALLTFSWVIISSYILIYCLKTIAHSAINIKLKKIIAIVYTLFPLFPLLSVYPTKDGFFTYFFLLYLTTLYQSYQTKAKCFEEPKFLLLHCIAVLMICLTRHQGIIIVGIEMVLLPILYRHVWKLILTVYSIAILLNFSFIKIMLPACHVEPGGKQEIVGTLFQQTARFLCLHPSDVTSEELSAINTILNADSIRKKYDYFITDPIKRDYKYNPRHHDLSLPTHYLHIDRTKESEELKLYIGAWWTMFLKHPDTYLEATTAVFIGFFWDTNRPLIELQPTWAENRHSAAGKYNFWHITKSSAIYQNNIEKIIKIPVFGCFFSIPLYDWIALILLFVLFKRKDIEGIILFLPIILSVCLLFVCPVALGRYMYPIVIALPLLFAYLQTNNKHQVCHK